MGVMASFIETWESLSPIVLVSRAAVFSAWFLAMVQVWKARTSPVANQAFVASVAIAFGQLALIWHEHLDIEVLTFFIAMAQVTMAISVVKIFRWAAHLTTSEQHRVNAVVKYRQKRDGMMKTYLSSALAVFIAAVVYFISVWIETGHF